MKKMLLVFNPKSGVQKFIAQLFDVADMFTAAGFLVTVYPTQAPGEAGNIITQYAGGYDYIVCSGGDGTIGEAIGALLPLDNHPVFGLIPSGTVNDFASSLGIPRDIMTAASIIIEGVVRPLDIGCFGKKHFSYVAAFGLFTDVAYATPQNIKNMLGNLAYFFEGVKRIGQVKSYRCKLTLDGEVIKGDFILGIVTNAHRIGGVKLPEEIGVEMDDGLFEVILLQTPESIKDRQGFIASLLNQDFNSDLLTIRKVREVGFVSTEPVAWTLDGDYGGEFIEVTLRNHHKALEIILPPD